MRFLAKSFDIGNMENLQKVTTCVARLAKRCTIRITADKMCFSHAEHVKEAPHKL